MSSSSDTLIDSVRDCLLAVFASGRSLKPSDWQNILRWAELACLKESGFYQSTVDGGTKIESSREVDPSWGKKLPMAKPTPTMWCQRFPEMSRNVGISATTDIGRDLIDNQYRLSVELHSGLQFTKQTLEEAERP